MEKDNSSAAGAAPSEAIEQLRSHQQQLDMDGVIVGVSRQAIEEVLAYIKSLLSARDVALEEAAKVAEQVRDDARRTHDDSWREATGRIVGRIRALKSST